MNRTRRAGFVPAVLAVALLAGCGNGRAGSTEQQSQRDAGATSTVSTLSACPRPSAPAGGDNLLPDLTLPCLGAGDAVPLRRLTGVPTVINLWASWCAPCREELPSFEAVDVGARGRVRVLGVVSEDARQNALAFAADTGIHFPSVVDDTGRLLRNVGRPGLPVTLFVDRTGQIVEVYSGEALTSSDLRRKIEERFGVDVG